MTTTILRRVFLSAAVGMLAGTTLFAQNVATNPVPRTTPTNWMARHEGMVEIAKKGNVDVLFLGDSITDQWRNRGSNVWAKYYAPRRAANFGIGGDRTQHVIWRLENGELDDALKPKLTVLMIGTNNSNTDSANDIAEGVETIVRLLRAKRPDGKVLLLAIFPRSRANDQPTQMETIKQVNARIAKLDDGKMVRFLDIGEKFLGPDGKLPIEIMPDFLHLSERGYQIWADAIEGTVVEMLK